MGLILVQIEIKQAGYLIMQLWHKGITQLGGLHMDKAGTKILKILLFIGVFGYLQYQDVKLGNFTMGSITHGLMMALAAYLIASLFGIVLSLTRNYIIAIIGTGALAVFLGYKLDEVTASISWLTEGRVEAALVALVILCIIGDIRTVKHTLVPSVAVKEGYTIDGVEKDDVNITMIMRNNLKKDPQSVLNFSNMLEERWGRKPSYEEVINYIDHQELLEDELEDMLNS